MVAEVQSLKMTLLTEQDNQGAAGPVQTLTKQRSATTQGNSCNKLCSQQL